MLQRKRRVKAVDIIRDLQSEMTLPQLIDKCRFSLSTLRSVFRNFSDVGAITKDHLAAQANLYKGIADLKGSRKWARTNTTFPLRIYDSRSPFTTGYVLDISEKGVRVKGIETALGDVKYFIVHSGAFGQGQAFVFEGKCRWVDKERLSVKQRVAGFEITDISRLDSSELRKLVRSIDDHHLDRQTSQSMEDTFGKME